MQIITLVNKLLYRVNMNLMTEIFPVTQTIHQPISEIDTNEINTTAVYQEIKTQEIRIIKGNDDPNPTYPEFGNDHIHTTNSEEMALDGLQRYNEWREKKIFYANQLHAAGMIDTKYIHLDDAVSFEHETIPVEVERDLHSRYPTVPYERTVRLNGRIPGLTNITQDLRLNYTSYNPFGFSSNIGKPSPDQGRKIALHLRNYDASHAPKKEPTLILLPNEQGQYVQGRDNVDEARVNFEVAKGVTAHSIAEAIIAAEAASTRKLLPVLVLAGMGVNKTAILCELYEHWPSATKKIYSFQDRAHINSRNGNKAPCDKILRFSDVKPEKVDRRRSTFPGLFLFDEGQFGDDESFYNLVQQCNRLNIKIIVTAIPYDLACDEWPVTRMIEKLNHRHIYRLCCRCEICRIIDTEMSAQLRSRPQEMFYEDLAPKNQWIRACLPCSLRYFPYCWVSKKSNPGTYDNRPLTGSEKRHN